MAEGVMRRIGLRTLAGLFVLAGSLVAAAGATAQELRTTREMLSLSRPAADRAVRKDLLSVLERVEPLETGRAIALTGASFATRPYATGLPGVCQRDLVSLSYDVIDGWSKGANGRLLPTGVRTTAQFHVDRLPVAEPRSPPIAAYEACERQDQVGKANWFAAENVEEAVQAAVTLRLAVDRVKAGSSPAFACELLNVQGDTRDCNRVFLETADLSNICSVEVVELDLGRTRLVYLDRSISYEITVIARMNSGAPSSIESIAFEELLIVG
jgi:hypothetical protein